MCEGRHHRGVAAQYGGVPFSWQANAVQALLELHGIGRGQDTVRSSRNAVDDHREARRLHFGLDIVQVCVGESSILRPGIPEHVARNMSDPTRMPQSHAS